MRTFWSVLLVLAFMFGGAADARAGALADRMANFPRWESKPPVAAAEGDLVYPAWMAGTWQVTSVLVEMIAPLAPEIVTPGMKSNRQYLNQQVRFLVRFGEKSDRLLTNLPLPPLVIKRRSRDSDKLSVVADRAFNGLNIAKAYLGDRAVSGVKIDPQNPNRQITLLPSDRQLISIVTARNSETPTPDRFVATEISQQQFRGGNSIYFNEVETTTSYQKLSSLESGIQADQVTAIYLSPQDPQYFSAIGRPVALYRYDLRLIPLSEVESS